MNRIVTFTAPTFDEKLITPLTEIDRFKGTDYVGIRIKDDDFVCREFKER
jgi:hypothetical protein